MDIHVIGTVVVGNGLEYDEVDFNSLPLQETQIAETITVNGTLYDVIIVDDEMFVVAVEDYGPSAEDLMEWRAASCGMDYWAGRV